MTNNQDTNSPSVVIACYKPHEGKEDELKAIVTTHVANLQEWGLATARTPVIMQASNGTILEVFEWVSDAVVEKAHSDERVGEIWKRFGEVCSYVSLNSTEEAAKVFCHFTPLN